LRRGDLHYVACWIRLSSSGCVLRVIGRLLSGLTRCERSGQNSRIIGVILITRSNHGRADAVWAVGAAYVLQWVGGRAGTTFNGSWAGGLVARCPWVVWWGRIGVSEPHGGRS
jgi:hypothetical protein